MSLARTYTVALTGVEGHLVEVEAHIADGLPATVLVGLPDTALREARDRIRAAILNSGQAWPKRKITIGLTPANLPKRGSGFDLAIALALLAADEDVELTVPEGMMFLAELGLDGRLRPVPGVLPAVVAAAAAGMTTVVVAADNRSEAGIVEGVTVVARDDLAGVIEWLRQSPPPPARPEPGPRPAPPVPGTGIQPGDMSDVVGQPGALAAVEVSAAGGHHLSLLGPPYSGKTMLAQRLPTILPDLRDSEALEVTSIHSIAGEVPPGTGLITRPPFCAPHHTASMAAIVGGGSGLVRPGAASLAHCGVLFLDEAPEFHRDVLDALRQPLEAGEVTVARARMYATFPARFTLVLAANPCPCARSATGSRCTCSPAAKNRYLGRLSGPLMDRVEVKVKLKPVESSRRTRRHDQGDTSRAMADRVLLARERTAARLADTPWRLNSEVPGSELRRSYSPTSGALRDLDHALEAGQITARGADKIVRVAWTLSDLAGKRRPGSSEVDAALRLRKGDELVNRLQP